jgi:hypothetical protein
MIMAYDPMLLSYCNEKPRRVGGHLSLSLRAWAWFYLFFNFLKVRTTFKADDVSFV